jgi:AcrR family transcriptional regulator
MKDNATRRRILEATIESIEAHGIDGCTIRNIAAAAGVTFSSVHYYFDSKDDLVDQALEMAIDGSFADLTSLWAESRSNPGVALQRVLAYLLGGAVRFPGVTRAGLQPLLMAGRTDGRFIVQLDPFLAVVSRDLSAAAGADDPDLPLRLVQAFSTALFLGISPDAYRGSVNLSFHTAEEQERLVRSLVDTVLRT